MLVRSLLILFISTVIIGCANHEEGKQQIEANPIAFKNSDSKKVVLIMMDSLMDTPLKRAIEEEKAPALEFLMEHGSYSDKLVSSYPTMSVVIDSSIITGAYPDQHRIPALIWYNEKNKQIVSYGNGLFEILKLGPSNVAVNSLNHFNNRDLGKEVSTIHEDLHKVKKQSASINTFIYRGNQAHTLHVPDAISKMTDLKEEYQTMGPKYLSIGSLAKLDPENKHTIKRLGINDTFATEELIYLLKENILPDFTIVYFSENDHTAHKKPASFKGVVKMDRHLQDVLNAFPSWEQALEDIVWVIISDSNQSYVKKKKKEALIDLRKPYADFNILELGEPVRQKDDLVITANERMAYIYKISDKSTLKKLAQSLEGDPRIAWVAWKENQMVHVISEGHDGMLSFDTGGSLVDIYQQKWTVEGNADILDLKMENGKIAYGEYPDALARLYGAMHSQDGEFIIADAKPGYEFVGESSPEHSGGGAHGSLHQVDSLSPIIVAGTDKNIENLRSVDLKKWVLEVLSGK
ncbi:alkaline phosphatase family protein [Bacillus haimaensis]|uniref:alkaline phosphatase family protein n=1 Tax=Bacillus haimaensis TaxID=3160967 RepID=UPI003AA94C87